MFRAAKTQESIDRTTVVKSGGFSSRLAFTFALVAMATALLASAISWIAWSVQFEQYVRANVESIAQGIATSASAAYDAYGGWNFSTFAVIPQVGVRTDVAVQILDTKNNIIYDEASMRIHARQMLEENNQNNQTPSNAYQSPGALAMVSRPSGPAVKSPILVGDQLVGYVRVWSYGNTGLLTDRDIALRNSSMLALITAGLVATIFAAVGGAAYSRKLVRPINCITNTARALRNGDDEARTGLAGDDEIALLGQTFDQMADSIKADRALERQLTSDVAHELRTPLMGIQATVECIEDGIYPADAEHLGTISQEVRRLTRLTNAILELSRLETGAMPFVSQIVDVSTPVRMSIDSHAGLFESLGLTLIDDIAPGLYVQGDPDRLQQAVNNLVSNAGRYTPEGGTVHVSAYARDGQAIIEVADTGIGMSPQDLESTFKRFWRADNARHRETGGAGVGLSIAKEIIDRHRGQIQVESVEGQGTTFTIILPLAIANGRTIS